MSGHQQRAMSETRATVGGTASPSYSSQTTGRPRGMNESRLTPGPGEESSLSPQDYNLQQSNLQLLKAELKLVTHERDSLRKELTKLNKTLSERELAIRRLGDDPSSPAHGRHGPLQLLHQTAGADAGQYDSMSRHGSQSMDGSWAAAAPATVSSKDHEKLRLHYERAMLDLQAMRKRLSDTVRDYETAKREADSARGKHKVALSKLESVAAEAGSLRAQFAEVSGQRDRLQQDLRRAQAQLKLDDGERRKEGGAKDCGDEPPHQAYRNAIYKYETMRDEYDALRSRYDSVVTSHSAAVSKLELSQEEVSRLKAQLEEALQQQGAALRERTAAIRERDGLKQQCTAAIRQWDNALRERNEFKEACIKLQQKHEDSNKEVNQAMASRIKANKEVKRLTEERNAAVYETNKILEERDTVHKEMERLQEDCSTAEARVKELETRNKDITSERESLRREIDSALAERDRALRRAHELRDQLGAGHDAPNKNSWNSNINSYDSIQQDRTKSKDSLDSGRLSDTKSYKERLEDLDAANAEVDRLRKLAEKLQQEVHECQQEADVSKRRRDWAFAERDKIVMERESIRQLCDRLRRERDRAVSDQAKAIRDADDVRKQKNEANKELKQMREQLEQQSHLACYPSPGGEMGLAEPERPEWLSLHLTLDSACGSDRLRGVSLIGGVDGERGADGGPQPVTVGSVAPDSAAAGRLMPGDRLLRVGSLDCANMTARLVQEAVRSSVGAVRLLVRRRRTARTTHLLLSEREYHGIGLEQGVYIGRIEPGSAAARDGTLSVGDRLLMVNGAVVDTAVGADAVAQLLDSSPNLTITVRPGVGLPAETATPAAAAASPYSSRRRDRLSTGGQRAESSPAEAAAGDGARSPLAMVRDIVCSGRRSKERSAPTEARIDDEAQNVLDQFNAVLESSEKADKRRRRGRRREERNGTWPKYRGGGGAGGSTELTALAAAAGAATVSRPGRRRERMPLSMLVDDTTKLDKSYEKSEESLAASPFDPYNYLLREQYGAARAPPPPDLGASLTPSDTSIDFSVKSVKLDKEGLEYYTKKSGKYSQSDSESNVSPVETGSSLAVTYLTEGAAAAAGGAAGPAAGRAHLRSLYGSPVSFVPPYMPYTHTHTHTHAPTSRYSSPVPVHLSAVSAAEQRRSAGYDPAFDPTAPNLPHGLYLHAPSPSLDYTAGYPRPGYLLADHRHGPGRVPDPALGPRARLASAPGSRLSSPGGQRAPSAGSVELGGDLLEPGSPPSFSVELLNPGGGGCSTSGSSSWRTKPLPGDLRNIVIERSDHQLGISISCHPSGGVFVAEVTHGSLASQVNLQVGDQILEVCGINLRTANHQMAASVLSQCGDSRRILVQYNPDRYELARRYDAHPPLSSGGEDEEDEDEDEDSGRPEPSCSGSPTPCNSPKPCRDEREREDVPPSGSSTLRGPLALGAAATASQANTLTRQQMAQVASTLSRSETVKRSDTVRRRQGGAEAAPPAAVSRRAAGDSSEEEDEESSARVVYLESAGSANLGVQLVGGNAVGIYVHSVETGSSAAAAGLRCGDRILEYNGADLRRATAEQAACELAKPADKVTVRVVYRYQRYLQVRDQPGDSFYVRAQFDYQPEAGNGTELKFHRDNILLVVNTMFNGQPGLWQAWLLDTSNGRKLHCGIIPSKFSVDNQLNRSQGDVSSGDPGRRSSVSIRRSIFRRKSKHQRSSSRESKELASFSDVSINEFSEPSVSTETVSSYQRVERLDSYISVRPVLVVGPLSELIADRLCAEYPHQFVRPALEVVRTQQAAIDQRVQQAAIVDYRRRGSHYQVLTAAAIRDWSDGDRHCVLDMDVSALGRLHRHRIHPIVLLVRFKSVKQIREVRESVYPMEKVCTKAAKDMHENARKLEHDLKNVLSATVPGGGNMAYLCTQVKAAVEQEQNKALWVPSGTI
ncbi:disks large homolog 5-like [Amphibalanus amphitrite]|uniref:disks large homolog 5-like n=1 Tax=Amphibalanus amphitrite TaxID=1232801 RepID=UPI001C902D91|nr:disks large homolog 5-like [Amphibalanus amphitrite]